MAEMLTLTPAAAKRVATIADKQAKPAILRLSVEGGGCSGFQYKLDLADEQAEDDPVSDTDGVVVVDPSVDHRRQRGGFRRIPGGAAFGWKIRMLQAAVRPSFGI